MTGAAHTLAEPIPPRFKPVFRDREELSAGHDLGREIDTALRRARYLIVICSRRAATSPWVEKEILQFKRLGREERLRCFIVDGEPWASQRGTPAGAEDECFPRSQEPAEKAISGESGDPNLGL